MFVCQTYLSGLSDQNGVKLEDSLLWNDLLDIMPIVNPELAMPISILVLYSMKEVSSIIVAIKYF